MKQKEGWEKAGARMGWETNQKKKMEPDQEGGRRRHVKGQMSREARLKNSREDFEEENEL